MKRLVILSTYVLSIFVIVSFVLIQPTKVTMTKQRNGLAVVELFTSEGCSSCPPADEAVRVVAAQHQSGVFILSFHVDYWDRLGWKDPFSSAQYTSRQQDYAKAFRLSSIYTPQVIVNGSEEFVGSDAGRLQQAIHKSLDAGASQPLSVDIKIENNNQVSIKYKLEASGTSYLNLALVQLHATTQVKAGEHNGLTLNHVNIVRDFVQVVEPQWPGGYCRCLTD